MQRVREELLLGPAGRPQAGEEEESVVEAAASKEPMMRERRPRVD